MGAVPVTETVKPGEVTYIHAMFNVPNVEEGRFSVVYRLCDPNGKKFGAHLRTVINVVPAKQEVEEEEEEVRASVSSLNTAITYEEELLAEVDAEPSAPAIVPEAPEEEPAFQYEESLNTLTAMGFSDVEMHVDCQRRRCASDCGFAVLIWGSEPYLPLEEGVQNSYLFFSYLSLLTTESPTGLE